MYNCDWRRIIIIIIIFIFFSFSVSVTPNLNIVDGRTFGISVLQIILRT